MTEGTTKKFGKRTAGFKRNDGLEYLLKSLNTDMQPSEQGLLARYSIPKMPLIFVMGPPRSGTTLLMQWLANTGIVSYPTNLLSRFYEAPIIGAKIQLMLTDPRYNFRDELGEFVQQSKYVSENGKTNGVLAPNEFWYFWRRFFHYGEIQYLDEQSLQRVDAAKFVAELAAIEAVFDKPFASKGIIINWNIPYVSSILDKVLFIHLKRHPLYNAQSLLETRVKFYDDQRSWYSFKPTEYNELKELNPLEQVAGQVYYTNNAIERGLGKIDFSRWLQVSYEEFCASPKQVFYQILEKLALQEFEIDNLDYMGPERFQSTNQIRLPEEYCRRIINTYKHFSGVELEIC